MCAQVDPNNTDSNGCQSCLLVVNRHIEQWGLTASASEVVTYPIPVSQVLCLLLTTKAITFRYSPWPTKITTKSFQAFSDCEPAYWFLVAKQQWGTYETANASNKLITITFPVSFAATAYSVALGHKGLSNWTNGANVNYVNKTVSDMTVYYCDGYGFSWLAIGMQQWGFLSGGGRETYTWTYPQSFESAVFSIQLTMRSGGSNDATYNAFKTVSYSLNKWQGYMSLKEDISFFLLAIGVQQWGVADNGAAAQNWSKTITLPIAFSNPNYIVAGSATIISGWYVLFTHSNKTTNSALIYASGCWPDNTSRYADWFALGY